MKSTPESSGLMKTVFRNSAWSTFSVVASPMLQFLFGGLTLRYVGLEATGFSLAVGAVLGIAARFGTCGIGEAALPAIAAALAAHDDRRARGLIGVILAVFGLSSAAAAVALTSCAEPFIAWSKSPFESKATATVFIVIACASHTLSQVTLAITTVLRAAGRYDLVTAVTTPLSLFSGIAACILVPLFPSLTTVALVGFASAVVSLIVSLCVAAQAVPQIRRPVLGFGEFPGLARYGFWIVLTNAFATLTSGIDDLVITGTCGAAAVPPWAIGKRLWLTAHSFLAQHTEHLIPTLSSLRLSNRASVDAMVMGMHWYILLLAAVGYTLMASCGDLIVGAVAGPAVASLCRPAILSYSLLGLAFGLVIIPVISAMADGASRPSFIVSLLSNSSQITAVFFLARTFGTPAVYYAPIAAMPVLLLATSTTATSIFDAPSAWRRIRPILVPMITGLAGIVISTRFPTDLSAAQRLAGAGLLAAGVLFATIGLERLLAVNEVFHRQLSRVIRHALDIILAAMHRVRGAARHRNPVKSEKVTS